MTGRIYLLWVLSLCMEFPFKSIAVSEGDLKGIIDDSTTASKQAAPDVKSLINSLSTNAHKTNLRLKDITLNPNEKSCSSKVMQTNNLGKCGSIFKSAEIGKNEAGNFSAQFLIFVSSSMPIASIRDLGQQAHKIGALIIFRGLIGGTFKNTQAYIQDLGIIADIDPPKYEDYKVTQVPTFMLVHNKVIDRISGHVSIWEALDQFKRKGELKYEARKLYDQLKQNTARK